MSTHIPVSDNKPVHNIYVVANSKIPVMSVKEIDNKSKPSGPGDKTLCKTKGKSTSIIPCKLSQITNSLSK